nr:hypothetical protein [Prevotella sp. MA2016]
MDCNIKLGRSLCSDSSGYLGYLVLAHYIRVHMKWSQQKKLTVGAICFVVGGLFTAWSFWWKAVPGMQMDTPITFLCCAVTTKLISQIPGSKYIIG